MGKGGRISRAAFEAIGEVVHRDFERNEQSVDRIINILGHLKVMLGETSLEPPKRIIDPSQEAPARDGLHLIDSGTALLE